MKLRTLLPVIVVATLMAGCGGGGNDGGDEPPAANPGGSVPDSATQSGAAFTAYLVTLAPDDTGEPMNVSGLTPPVSDTDEPVDIR